MIWDDEKLVKVLRKGGVAVMPTDTIYGLVGRAEDEKTANRIYTLKRRAPEKPCIILIGDIKELEKFSINLSREEKNEVKKYWPGAVSVILDCGSDSFSYLHRGTKTLAFRIPNLPSLRGLLSKTGPLIAPSVNPEGLPPAGDIVQAREYFGSLIDLYIDGGKIFSKASKLIKLLKDGSINILRE